LAFQFLPEFIVGFGLLNRNLQTLVLTVAFFRILVAHIFNGNNDPIFFVTLIRLVDFGPWVFYCEGRANMLDNIFYCGEACFFELFVNMTSNCHDAMVSDIKI
jgi:hypothetical protein